MHPGNPPRRGRATAGGTVTGTPRTGGAATIEDVIIGEAEFELLVGQAMDLVPEPFASALDEVAVVVEDRAPRDLGPLYGLYQGVPLTEGGMPAGMLPPRISVYMHPLIDDYTDEAELVEQVRITVLHELGHHLGFDERQLEELGYG